MQDLFTYAWLGTFTGSVAATVFIVDFLKGFISLKRFSTRFLVLVVAEGVIIAAAVTVGRLTLENMPLYVLNGLLVAASAMGRWQARRPGSRKRRSPQKPGQGAAVEAKTTSINDDRPSGARGPRCRRRQVAPKTLAK